MWYSYTMVLKHEIYSTTAIKIAICSSLQNPEKPFIYESDSEFVFVSKVSW